MLDVRRMQLLRTVVTSGSVTAAARELGYTASAVSQQMAALEKEAGIALLERTGRGVRPTDAGRLLAEYAARIGKHVAEAETALADLRAGRTGRVTFSYFATAGASLVAPALARLRQEHPGVRVELKLADPEDPLPEVKEGRADLALVVRPPDRLPTDGIRFVHLLDDGYRAVLPAGHRLAGKRVLDLADLADEPWVGSEWPGPCLDAILDACDSAGFSPRTVVQSEDYATAQGFVAAGLGVSLVPQLGLGGRHPGVVVRKVRNPVPVRAIYAAVRESSPVQPALRGLLDALRQAATAGPTDH
ncbi:LysR family transcriptional regulator [Micromonospora inositola]|uniref:DNA-binding transcriptional regulator, LysR family n=1 Tax=Micromonospora inositola TaxID=47865 RepID=A0A1C5J7M9_9ACTN|nr:LysR family transcriptional regulator [Micromonospora inositola]SCG66523.1 DNA-binding transcriptional regulator, LysR family [Micromonospora inositola]